MHQTQIQLDAADVKVWYGGRDSADMMNHVGALRLDAGASWVRVDIVGSIDSMRELHRKISEALQDISSA